MWFIKISSFTIISHRLGKKKKNEVKTRKRLLSKERQKQTESEKERRKERKLIYLKVINLKVTKDGRAERAVLCLFVSLL